MAITAKLIREQAALLQRYRHGAKRAAAIAAEIERLNAAVAAAAKALALEDEPSRYAVAIEQARRTKPRSRKKR